MDQFQNNDLDAFWMPFTANRDFKENPRMLVSADGLYYRESEGRQILDAAAGLWCVNAGHNHLLSLSVMNTSQDLSPQILF